MSPFVLTVILIPRRREKDPRVSLSTETVPFGWSGAALP